MPTKFLLVLGWLLTMQQPVTVRWVVSAASSLRVNGSTNINTFACDIPRYGQTDTLLVIPAGGGGEIELKGRTSLRIGLFDCHNAIMTSDLRKTLREEQYPQLCIRFVSLARLPVPGEGPQTVKGMVDIELAGVSRQMELTYQVSGKGAQAFCLTGMRDVNFSDFGLKAPRKLGGMIRTNDRLSIEFLLQLSVIQPAR